MRLHPCPPLLSILIAVSVTIAAPCAHADEKTNSDINADTKAVDVSATKASTETKQEASAHAPRTEVIRVNESRTNLLIFPTGKETFLNNIGPTNPDVFLSGSAGTTVSIDANRLVFHTGQIFVNSGKATLTIGSRLASIRLSPDTTAVLEIHPRKPLRVAVLSGPNNPVKMKLRGRGRQVSLSVGEEMYVSDSVMKPEEYIPKDPESRSNLPPDGDYRGLEIVKRSFDAKKLLAWENSKINHEKISPWHVLAAGGTEFTLLKDGTGAIHLRSGELFVFAPVHAIVETALASAHGNRDALFAVDTDNGNVRIRALSGPGDTTVVVGHNKMPVHPGQEIILSDHTPTEADTHPKDAIGRRNFSTRAIDDKLKITYTDFSIISLLNSADYLKPIKKPVWANEKQSFEKLIQTAAAIDTLTRSRGPYSGMPRETQQRTPKSSGQPI